MASTDTDQWRKTARKYQQNLYNMLGDRCWDYVENNNLDKKIGYALFSAPTVMNDGKLEYTKNELKHIQKIISRMKSLKPDSNMTYVSYVYVVIRLKSDGKEGVQVVFKTPKYNNDEPDLNKSYFIDCTCRTYVSWDDYLNNNNLPECLMCYPSKGIYKAIDGIVEIGFRESPECDVSKTVMKGLDISSSVVSLTTGAVGLAALVFPISLPIVLGATTAFVASGSYDIGRSIYKLTDRKKHHQSIGLDDPSARRTWINIAASGVGIVAVGGTALTKSVKAVTGASLSSAEAITLRVINISSLAVGGINIVHEFVNVIIKFMDGTLEVSDILQFSAACFFFVNVFLSFRTAEKLIGEVAANNVDIGNLFQTTKNSTFSTVKMVRNFTESSEYSILRKIIYGIQPIIMPCICLNEIESFAFEIINLIDKMQLGIISWDTFMFRVIDIVNSKIWNKYKEFFLKAYNEMCQAFGTKDLRSFVLKENVKPFLTFNPDLPQYFSTATNSTVSQIFNENGNNKNEEKEIIIHMGQKFIEQFPENNAHDYLNKYKFFCQHFIEEYNKIREMYETELDSVSSSLNFNREDFHKNYGIEGNLHEYFFNQTFLLFDEDKEIFNKMNEEYNESKEKMTSVHLGFLHSETCTYHAFCGPKGQKNLTKEQYWLKTKELTGIGFNDTNSTMLCQNNFVLIIPFGIDIGITALIFYGTYEIDFVMGILTVLKQNKD